MPRAIAVAAVVASACITACGSAETSSLGNDGGDGNVRPTPSADDGNAKDSGNAGFSTDDAGTAPADAPRYGLCNVGEGSACDPDDDGLHAPRRSGVGRCDTSWADAGSGAGAGADNNGEAQDAGPAQKKAITGCRLTADEGETAPQCLPSNPGGTDGSSCESGEDCAPGFDCVEGAKGPVCRRYCCSGSCEGSLSQTGGPTFCDVKRLVEVDRLAPVCMPLKRCTLLDEKSCAGNETCAITETGTAGCVPIGKVKEGASCEAEHCATGLTCLGAPGSRKCYQLCRVGENTCSESQVCKTSALFKDPQFGVCGGP